MTPSAIPWRPSSNPNHSSGGRGVEPPRAVPRFPELPFRPSKPRLKRLGASLVLRRGSLEGAVCQERPKPVGPGDVLLDSRGAVSFHGALAIRLLTSCYVRDG